MLKKFLVLGLCITISLSFPGCSKKTSTFNADVDMSKIGDTGGLTLPIDNKRTQITIMTDSSYSDRDNSLVINELRKRTGIDVRIMAVPRETIVEKVKVLIAGKNVPDAIYNTMTINEINNLGVQGLFAPINKYIDQLPNFKRIFADDEKNNWIFKSWSATDGNIYAYPKYDISRDVNHGYLYRKDIFDKNGIKEWTNTDEFYQAMKKLKEIYPDSIPYASKTQSKIFADWSTSWGLAGYDPYYDENGKVWKYSCTDLKYKNMLDFMKKMYKEGLIDPEFLTASQANWTEKMTQPNKSFATFDWIGQLDPFYEQAKGNTPDYDLRYAYPIGPTGNVIKLKNVDVINSITKNGHELLTLKLMDYLLSPSGAELMSLGVEGKTYTKTSDGKIKYLGFDDGKVIGISDLEEKYGMFMEGIYKRFDKRCIYFNYSPKEQEAQDKIVKENRFEPEDPVLNFNEEEAKIITDVSAKLKKAAEEFSAKYIIQNQGDDAWNEWNQKAKSLGADKIIEAYNNAQKRYNEK